MIKAFAKEFGKEKTLEIAERVIQAIARESDVQLVRMIGGNSLEHFARIVDLMSHGKALEQEIIDQDSRRLYVNTTGCRYAKMYEELGIPDLGYLFSCSRDFAMIEGFNPRSKLTRTQTLMEGAPFCDFRFHLDPDE